MLKETLLATQTRVFAL